MPSHATLKCLAASTLLASLVCFGLLAENHGCGAQSWDCASYAGITVVAIAAGLALGLLLTAVVVLLGWCLLVLRPSARAPEARSRAGRVALQLVALHLLAFGGLQAISVLPLGWVWWLGVFGAVGMHPAGSVYLVVP